MPHLKCKTNDEREAKNDCDTSTETCIECGLAFMCESDWGSEEVTVADQLGEFLH